MHTTLTLYRHTLFVSQKLCMGNCPTYLRVSKNIHGSSDITMIYGHVGFLGNIWSWYGFHPARRTNVLHPVNMRTCVLHDQMAAQMNRWFHEFDQGLTRFCWPIWGKMAWCRGILSSETVTWHSFRCCCLHSMWHWTCRSRWRRRSGGAQHTHNVERYPSVFARSHTSKNKTKNIQTWPG